VRLAAPSESLLRRSLRTARAIRPGGSPLNGSAMDDGGFRWDQIPVQLYLVAAGVAVVLVVIAAVVAWVLWRRARRSVAWRTAKLRLQAELDPSPARRAVANLQVELDEAVRQTTLTVQVLTDDGWATADLPALTRRLATVARPLHSELTILAREPDGELVGRALPEATARVRRATEIGDGIRQAAATSLRQAADEGLDHLDADAEIEERALELALRELNEAQRLPLVSRHEGH